MDVHDGISRELMLSRNSMNNHKNFMDDQKNAIKNHNNFMADHKNFMNNHKNFMNSQGLQVYRCWIGNQVMAN